jgi:hypothetical protein
MEVGPCNHCCRAKVISITYSECVSVALVTQKATHIRHIILPPVACPVLLCLYTLPHKRQDFWKEVTEHKMWVLVFSTILSETFFFLRRSERDVIIKVNMSSCKVLIILVRFQGN